MLFHQLFSESEINFFKGGEKYKIYDKNVGVGASRVVHPRWMFQQTDPSLFGGLIPLYVYSLGIVEQDTKESNSLQIRVGYEADMPKTPHQKIGKYALSSCRPPVLGFLDRFSVLVLIAPLSQLYYRLRAKINIQIIWFN